MKFTSDDKLCVCVPLFHCFGVVLATMNCLTHGCTEVMVERFNPLVVLASIHKERCTALYGVPTMFIAELHHPMFDMFDMSSLRTGIMAGSLCPVELMKQVERMEAAGEIVVIRPQKPVVVDRIERDIKKLTELYEEGYRCAEQFVF